MNVKRRAIAALRNRRLSRPIFNGWKRELAQHEIGPLTARMLKMRHIAELVGDNALHFPEVRGLRANALVLDDANWRLDVGE